MVNRFETYFVAYFEYSTAELHQLLKHKGIPQGLWGSGENGYLFSGGWGALVIILGELVSKLIILGI